VRVKMRKGGTQLQRVTELEPERLLRTEFHFPGARIAHDHRLEPTETGSQVTHAITISGLLWILWALMLGRGRQMADHGAVPIAPMRRPAAKGQRAGAGKDGQQKNDEKSQHEAFTAASGRRGGRVHGFASINRFATQSWQEARLRHYE